MRFESLEEMAPDLHVLIAFTALKIASGVAGASSGGIFPGHSERWHRRSPRTPRSPASAAARRPPWNDKWCPPGFRARRKAPHGNRGHVATRRESCRSTAHGCADALRLSKTNSSVVSQPMPWTKPPSIWPMIDRRIERTTDIMQDVDAIDPHFAGQGVDRHFRTGGAIGEIEEGPALAPWRGPSKSWASCKSRSRKAARAPDGPAWSVRRKRCSGCR